MAIGRPLHTRPRRSVIRTDEHRRDLATARQDGHDAAAAISEVQLEVLQDDLDDIIELVERGRPKVALDLAARTLQMTPEELFGLLPAQTGAALVGYLQGLIEGKAPTADANRFRGTRYGRR